MEYQVIAQTFEVHEIELVYKNTQWLAYRPDVSSGSQVAEIFRSTWHTDKIGFVEQFKVMLLNHANKVLGIIEVATGGLTSCTVDPRLVFSAALKSAATRIILAHNHPSGNLRPSPADLTVTKKLIEGAKLLDISVLDHIILTRDSYFSFAEDGLIS